MFNNILNMFRTKQMKINHQKKVAKQIVKGLTSLPGLKDKPTVAGGAARDWFLDRVASDIDIFLYSSLSVASIKEQLKNLNIHCKIKTGFVDSGNTKMAQVKEDYVDDDFVVTSVPKSNGIVCVFETVLKGEKVQFIFINQQIADYVDRFPIDICMVMWKDEKFITTTKFMQSVNTGVLTLYNKCKQRYIDKIKAKFLDFDFKDSTVTEVRPTKISYKEIPF